MDQFADVFRHFVPVLEAAAVLDRCPHRWTPLSIGKVTDAGRLQGARASSRVPFDIEGMRLGTHDRALPAVSRLLEKHCDTAILSAS